MKHLLLRLLILVTVLTTGGVVHAQQLVFSTFEGHRIGTETILQVMTEAYGRIGITIEIRRYPGERALHYANEGKVDGELFRKKEGIVEAFPNLVKVPVCIHRGAFVGFARDDTFSLHGWSSLRSRSVGYKRGVKAVEMNLVPGTHAEPVASMEQAFRKLSLGRTDIVIDVRPDGLATIKKLGLKGLRVLEPPLLTVESFHYLHVKNSDLVAPLAEALKQMAGEGLIRRIQLQVEQSYH